MITPVSTLSASVPVDLARAAQGASASGKPSPAEVQKAARQFEAIMVRQLLAPSIQPLMEGGLGGAGGGQGGGVYGYLLTDTLATSVTQGGGLGLSNVIARQLAPSPSAALADDSE